jgi:hypothetical protein
VHAQLQPGGGDAAAAVPCRPGVSAPAGVGTAAFIVNNCNCCTRVLYACRWMLRLQLQQVTLPRGLE